MILVYKPFGHLLLKLKQVIVGILMVDRTFLHSHKQYLPTSFHIT